MSKKRAFVIISIILTPLVLLGLFVVITDPFFHYHVPLKGYPYVLESERYQNDGIAKHFDYEILITGSSTSQVILPSYAEELWGLKTVRTSFAGGSLKETADLVDTAVKYNDDLQVVIRGLDLNRICQDKDAVDYEDLPLYMYDKNPFNDYKYLFNKDVLMDIGLSFVKLIKNEPADSFDDYENWNDYKTFGREAVISTFQRLPETDEVLAFGDEDLAIIRDNLNQNIVDIAAENPDIEFIVFVPPVAVTHWDGVKRSGSLDYTLEVLDRAFTLLLEQDNIKVFAFDDCTDITCDLDNYIDSLHYGENVGKYMLESMANGEHEITKENKDEYIRTLKNIYSSYDYDSIFE